MIRIVFIVEGATEISFVDKIITPHLIALGYNISITAQTIVTNRKQHKKGGVSSYGKYKNEVIRTFSQGNVIVTTLIDFFKLPTDFPGFTTDSTKINEIETAIFQDIGEHNFIPYIQRHEIEALMFSSIEGFELVLDDDEQLKQLEGIMLAYPNPEDINNSPETAPSKRIGKVFEHNGIGKYHKTTDGEMIFEMIGIDIILEKCPRFRDWIAKIIKLIELNICR